MKHEGSLHLPLSQLSDAEGSLLPADRVPAELLSLFESVRDQRVGVYCASGARAQRFVQAYAELAPRRDARAGPLQERRKGIARLIVRKAVSPVVTSGCPKRSEGGCPCRNEGAYRFPLNS